MEETILSLEAQLEELDNEKVATVDKNGLITTHMAGTVKITLISLATNELIERRLNVQKHNKKCKYESGYICGDITQEETKQLLYNQIKLWRKQENLKSKLKFLK